MNVLSPSCPGKVYTRPTAWVDGSFQTLHRDHLLVARRDQMSLGTILLIVLILMLLGVIPTWPHSRGWGYGPSGLLGIVLLVVLILVLTGRI